MEKNSICKPYKKLVSYKRSLTLCRKCIFFFRKKMPNEQHNCPKCFQIKEEAIKIQNDMAQLRVNPHIIEKHKTLFFFGINIK